MKRTKKSQKKTKFLLILIVLTAVLSITATYAWFSTQKDVEISTLRLNIEVAESLEISLNGKEWTNKITINDMRQLYGTAASGHQASLYDEDEDGSGNANYIPKELLPVSTTGEVANGKLLFMKSLSYSNNTLKAIACSEADLLEEKDVATKETNNAAHPYLVFDIYLKNLSAKTAGDELILNTGSKVWTDTSVTDTYAGASKAGTGAENAMRVGFVQYMNTLDATTSTQTGSEVRALQPDDTTNSLTAKAAIWEPNDLNHIQEVVNNNSRVSGTEVNVTTFGVIFDEDAVADASAVTVDSSATAATSGVTAEQKTVKPVYTVADGTTTAVPLTTGGTASGSDGTDVTGDIKLPQNTISKFRVYVWLEGQDVDCINTASMAGKLDVTIKLKKEGSTGQGGVTYAPSGT